MEEGWRGRHIYNGASANLCLFSNARRRILYLPFSLFLSLFLSLSVAFPSLPFPSLTHTRSAASVVLSEASRKWHTRCDARSMKNLRGSSPDLSAAALCLAKPVFLRPESDRRRPSASRRITSITIALTNHTTTPHHTVAAAASPPPPPHSQPRRPRHSSPHLDPRLRSLLAVEAPLKRRRKQVLLLPTSTRRPP